MATGVAFNAYKKKLFGGSIALASDTLKIALLADTWTPNIDTDEFFDDISANELATAHGYTAGGATVGGKSVTQDDVNDKGVFDITDPTWTADGTGFTCRYAVLYKSTGDPATSSLLAYWDFGGNQNPVSIAFTLIVNAAGLMDIA